MFTTLCPVMPKGLRISSNYSVHLSSTVQGKNALLYSPRGAELAMMTPLVLQCSLHHSLTSCTTSPLSTRHWSWLSLPLKLCGVSRKAPCVYVNYSPRISRDLGEASFAVGWLPSAWRKDAFRPSSTSSPLHCSRQFCLPQCLI